MKVFELMAELAELPAGGEVIVSKIMTLKELTDCQIVDNIDGEDNYSVGGHVNSVDSDGKLAVLYI